MCLDKPTLQVTAVYSVSGIRHSWLSCFWKKKTNLKFFWVLVSHLFAHLPSIHWVLTTQTLHWRLKTQSYHTPHVLTAFTVFFLGTTHKTWKACSMKNKRGEVQWRLFAARNSVKRYKESYLSGSSPHSCFLEQSSTYRRPKLPSKTWLESRLHGIAKVKNTWLT